MNDEADVLQVLPFHHIDDVGDVGVEIDVLRQEVRTFAEPGEGGREHLVALLLQKIRHTPPAPAAVPGAVDQHERLRRSLGRGLRGCFADSRGGREPGAGGNAAEVAAGDGWFAHEVASLVVTT